MTTKIVSIATRATYLFVLSKHVRVKEEKKKLLHRKQERRKNFKDFFLKNRKKRNWKKKRGKSFLISVRLWGEKKRRRRRMSLERKKSDCNVQQESSSGSNECLLQKRSNKHRDSLSKKNDQIVPRMYSGDDVEALRCELEAETRNRWGAQGTDVGRERKKSHLMGMCF